MTDTTKADVQAAVDHANYVMDCLLDTPGNRDSRNTARAILQLHAENERLQPFERSYMEAECEAARLLLENEALKRAAAWRPVVDVPVDICDFHIIIELVEEKIGLTNVRIAAHADQHGKQAVYRQLNDEFSKLLRRLKAVTYHTLQQPLPTPPEPKRD